MKYILISILGLFVLPINKSSKELHQEFHDYYHKGQWNQMDKYISDDFRYSSYNGNTMNKAEYINFLKGWSKIYETKWTVVSIEKEEKDKITTIEKDDNIYYNYFFNNNPLSSKLTYEFKDNQLIKLYYDTLIGHTEKSKIYYQKYAAFSSWVAQKYPKELLILNSSETKNIKREKELLELYISSK